MKNIIFSILSFCLMTNVFGHLSSERIYIPDHIKESENGLVDSTKKEKRVSFYSDNVIIGFDLHDVLLKRSTGEFLRTMVSGKGLSLAAKMLAGKLGWKNDVSEGFKKVKEKGGSAEGYAAHFQETNPELSQLIQELGDTYVPMDGMQELVKELQTSGYETILASDIGLNMLERARKKNSLKDLLDLLPRAQIVSYKGKSSFEGPISISPVQKPNDQFFELFKLRFNPNHKYIIFVDDKVQNVKAAQENGMIGIVFITPEQFKKDLQRLGILTVNVTTRNHKV